MGPFMEQEEGMLTLRHQILTHLNPRSQENNQGNNQQWLKLVYPRLNPILRHLEVQALLCFHKKHSQKQVQCMEEKLEL